MCVCHMFIKVLTYLQSTLVLIAEAVFVLARRETGKLTETSERPIHAGGGYTTGVDSRRIL